MSRNHVNGRPPATVRSGRVVVAAGMAHSADDRLGLGAMPVVADVAPDARVAGAVVVVVTPSRAAMGMATATSRQVAMRAGAEQAAAAVVLAAAVVGEEAAVVEEEAAAAAVAAFAIAGAGPRVVVVAAEAVVPAAVAMSAVAVATAAVTVSR